MKELLLKTILSRGRECTTFSMNTGPDFDPWNLKLANFYVYPLHFRNHFGSWRKVDDQQYRVKSRVNAKFIKKYLKSGIFDKAMFVSTMFLCKNNSIHQQTPACRASARHRAELTPFWVREQRANLFIEDPRDSWDISTNKSASVILIWVYQ